MPSQKTFNGHNLISGYVTKCFKKIFSYIFVEKNITNRQVIALTFATYASTDLQISIFIVTPIVIVNQTKNQTNLTY